LHFSGKITLNSIVASAGTLSTFTDFEKTRKLIASIHSVLAAASAVNGAKKNKT
jgi:hypothetical protein